MSRVKLKEYQDTYAQAMAKYGLQRGIEGSEARHTKIKTSLLEIDRVLKVIDDEERKQNNP